LIERVEERSWNSKSNHRGGHIVSFIYDLYIVYISTVLLSSDIIVVSGGVG